VVLLAVFVEAKALIRFQLKRANLSRKRDVRNHLDPDLINTNAFETIKADPFFLLTGNMYVLIFKAVAMA
jgi:hypothetical protein